MDKSVDFNARLISGGDVEVRGAFDHSYISSTKGAPETAAWLAPAILDAEELLAAPAPPRRWLIEGLIPGDDVTLLSGDGGIGKTTLALQLGLACAWNLSWIGMQVHTAGPAVYLSAEEPENELRFRLHQVSPHFVGGMREPGRFTLMTCASSQAELMEIGKDQKLRGTPLLDHIKSLISTRACKLLILDAAADVFGGNEVVRSQVRQFIAQLRAMAIEAQCAVVVLAHPSQEGMRSGSGMSGSTHWNNSVRSRLYLSGPQKREGEKSNDANADDDDPALADIRTLKVMKANRAPSGKAYTLRWTAGCFVRADHEIRPPQPCSNADRQHFLQILAKLDEQGQRVSLHHGRNYAPAMIAEHSNQALSKRRAQMVMQKLLDEGVIKQIEEGSPARRRSRLIVIGKGADQ